MILKKMLYEMYIIVSVSVVGILLVDVTKDLWLKPLRHKNIYTF